MKGGADKSYGIQVAKLAGVPDSVIERAKELAEELSENDITETVVQASGESTEKKPRRQKLDQTDINQMSFFDTVTDEAIVNELMSIDVSHLTPIDALNTVYALQNKLKNRWKPE